MKYRISIWLIKLLLKRKRLTLKEIQEEWKNFNRDFNITLHRNTFMAYKQAAEDMFDVNINCDRKTNEYYIENPKEITDSDINKWIMQVASSTEVLTRRRTLSNRILLESTCGGEEFLDPITEAMMNDNCITIEYYSYWMELNSYTVEPYFIKSFKNRWYLIGFCREREGLRVYAFDRIKTVTISEEHFYMKAQNYPNFLYKDNFGIINAPKEKTENIHLRFTIKQAPYIITRPLHHSQEIISYENGFMDITLNVKVTLDFMQELLSYGTSMKIISPPSLIKKYKEILNEMYEQYGEFE